MRVLTSIRNRVADIRDNKARRDASHAALAAKARSYIVGRAEPVRVR